MLQLWRDPDSSCRNQVHVLHFCAKPNLCPSCFLWRLGEKLQQILVTKAAIQAFQVGRERYRCSGESDVIRLTAGFVRKLREINLAPIILPIAVPEVPGPWTVDGRDDDARLHSFINGSVQVWVLQITRTVIAVDA